MKYKPTFDKFVITITIIFFILIISVATISFYTLFLAIILALYFSINLPIYFIVDEEYIIIKTIFRKIKIKKNEIISLKKVNFNTITMTTSTKGVFGYLGSSMEDAQSFITDRNNVLQIKTKFKNYLISIVITETKLKE